MKIRITHEKDMKHICDITTQVCGLPLGALANKSREQKYQIPRMVASNIARHEKKIHYNTIAKAFNRHRSSIYHYEKQHKALFSSWRNYRDMFISVFNAYAEKEYKFIDHTLLKSLLKEAGIKDVKNPKVEIIISLQGREFSVKSNYQSFTRQVEKIKSVLSGYNYDLSINLK